MFHKLTRLYNRIYAFFTAHFWMSCPICGEKFGGHECSDTGLMVGWNSGQLVCRACGLEAEKQNKAWRKHNPPPVYYI